MDINQRKDSRLQSKGFDFFCCLLSVICYLLPIASAVEAAPAIQHWTTDNGAKVYFVPAPELPMVDVQVIFDAGSSKDADKPGVALLTNSLLNEGAANLDADQIAETFEDLGARFGASSHRDMAVVSLRSLTDAESLTPALETVAVILHDPTFPTDSFERVRNQLLIALRAQLQSPGKIASKAFFKAMYNDHPYASPVLGTKESLIALKRKDVIAYHKAFYVANNAIIAIVGALSRADAEKMVDILTSNLPIGSAAPALPQIDPVKSTNITHIEHPSTQTHVLMGHPGMKRGDPDYFALYVGNHILGGSGLVSRISEEIREKRGLSYSAYSYFSPMRGLGPYTLGLQTSNEQTQQALQVLHQTLQEFIDKGPTAKELKSSKQNITGGFPLRISSNSKIVNNLAVIGFYGLPLDYLDTFNSKVDAVSIDHIRDAFKRRVHPEKMVTITVGTSTAAKNDSPIIMQ